MAQVINDLGLFGETFQGRANCDFISKVRHFSFNYIACEIKLLSLQFKKVRNLPHADNVVVVFTENRKF